MSEAPPVAFPEHPPPPIDEHGLRVALLMPAYRQRPRCSSSERVERAPYREPAALQHVRIDHGRREIAVPEQFLNRPDVVTAHQQVRREAVP